MNGDSDSNRLVESIALPSINDSYSLANTCFCTTLHMVSNATETSVAETALVSEVGRYFLENFRQYAIIRQTLVRLEYLFNNSLIKH